jgi:hypothetical protein
MRDRLWRSQALRTSLSKSFELQVPDFELEGTHFKTCIASWAHDMRLR